MKKLLPILILLAQPALADNCRLELTSQMTSQRTVGAVVDLVKNKSENSCQVKFRIKVDNEWHNVDWTQTGFYQTEVLCQMAIRQGTNDLLVQLPGKFKSESKMVCKSKEPKPVILGYEGKETEFGLDQQNPMYFKIGNISKCRMFKGHHADGVSNPISGVICLNNNELWTFVDKF